LAYTLARPCLGCEPKARVATNDAKGGGRLTTVKKEFASQPINSGNIMDVIDG
jgi:hypothetical protein